MDNIRHHGGLSSYSVDLSIKIYFSSNSQPIRVCNLFQSLQTEPICPLEGQTCERIQKKSRIYTEILQLINRFKSKINFRKQPKVV